MSLEILKDQLKKEEIGGLYLFYGPEVYLKTYYVKALKDKVLNVQTEQLNYFFVDGKTDVKRISDICETVPAFSDRKVVVIKNSGLLKPKGRSDNSEGGKEAADSFYAYLQKLPSYTCLILYEEEVDKRIKVFDFIKKNGVIVEFTYQKPADLAKWATNVLKARGKTIGYADASQLIEISEPGMNDIMNQVDKLALYIGDRSRVSGSDIEIVCSKSIKSRIFDLTDAIAAKDRDKAFGLLNEMIVSKEPVQKILFMIARQFRLLLQMKALNKKGVSTSDAASKLGIAPYAAGKLAKQLGGFTEDTLKSALQQCLEFDLAVKTGKINDRIAAELLITKFS